ncbi:MAG: ATP-grasp domain-containing protein [Treponema sp.]|jgi:biotin carboxylase|nr:ATP-grasp domain-containing protein [Treponema sp.]
MEQKKRDRILILGAGVMQGPAIRIAKEMGLETVVVDADPQAPLAAQADRFERIDLKDKEGIEALGRSLIAQGGLSGVMTAGTDFSPTVAWVAEKLSLPGIPYETALDAQDKERMRRRFKAAGVPSPEFTILTSPPGEDFALPFAYPVVVKPVDNMGARGCRRADTPEELGNAVTDALAYSRSGRAIVEEYMPGPEFSADAIVSEGEVVICGLADRHIFFPPYFIEMGHTMPANLDTKTAGALLNAFILGIRALGITRGAAKGDIKLTPRGPMIGEIAARLSGGYMSGWTYPYASGAEPARGAILVALGKKPEGITPLKSWTSAERAFISIPGRVKSFTGLEEARALPFVRDLFLRVRAGSRVNFPVNNVTKCGNVISAAPGRDDAVAAAEKAARMVLIRLEAPDEETEGFLFPPAPAGPRPLGVSSFQGYPPDSFALPEEIRRRLLLLPEPDYPSVPGDMPDLSLFPFPEFTGSGLLDYTGRTIAESLEALRALTGLPLPLCGGPERGSPGSGIGGGSAGTGPGKGFFLGRRFWTAFIRGGYQGGAYAADSFLWELKHRRE